MNNETQAIKRILTDELANRDLEFVDATSKNADDTIEVDANTLEPVTIKEKGIMYIPVPIKLIVTVDRENNIKEIKTLPPDPALINAAKIYIEGLISNKQLAGLDDQPLPKASHAIKINTKGQKVVRRIRFN